MKFYAKHKRLNVLCNFNYYLKISQCTFMAFHTEDKYSKTYLLISNALLNVHGFLCTSYIFPVNCRDKKIHLR